MDKNTIIGFTLLFIMLITWQQMLKPSQAQIEEMKRVEDSIKKTQQIVDIAEKPMDVIAITPDSLNGLDSLQKLQLSSKFGDFYNAAVGKEEEFVLENDVLKVTFSNKGGRIKSVLLKEYFKLGPLKAKDEKLPLYLMEDDKDVFNYTLPLATNGEIATKNLFFETNQEGKIITFRAKASDNQFFEQKYSLKDGSYAIDYAVQFVGLDNLLKNNTNTIDLTWVQHLDKFERNSSYERTQMSTTYFKAVDEQVSYCKLAKSNIQDISGQPIEWMAHSSQFFNSALLAKNQPFTGGVFETIMLEENDEDLKKLHSQIKIPYSSDAKPFEMELFVGPKEYKTLAAYNNEFEYTVPYGWSIIGTVNRYIIRPIFGFLGRFIGNQGIIILVLTLIVKLLLYPLTYRMLYSQSKMSALKPQIEKIKEKFKDEPQQQQMETMKMYREFGVNPLGGCFPMLLQMPIWFALYRFFPAAIEFRQASFLWASDLSSYDVFAKLPFEIPFYGEHISMFTILWAASTIVYTVYNTRNMDMSAMGGNGQMMMYMQYFMPIMFLFFFNNFASGLTVYLLFSSLLNIAQTVLTKNVVINQDKIKAKLEEKRKQPKKKGGFQQRLEEAMKQQQQIQQQRTTQKQNKPTNVERKKRGK
jgi:YidC/Oxa1 family membrane protein insertase